MRIQHNIEALNTNRNLTLNHTKSNKVLEKLSSEFKINRAGDDVAGLAISEKMRGQIRGLNMAEKNAQDGISLIQTAEGAMNEVHSLLQRGRELAVQAANDTNVEADRAALQLEISEINKEIDRIGSDTEFNTRKILNGTGIGASDFDREELIKKLEEGWLENAEAIVDAALGTRTLSGGQEVVVSFKGDGPGGYAAMVGRPPAPHNSMKLILDSDSFGTNDSDDRKKAKIVHEWYIYITYGIR